MEKYRKIFGKGKTLQQLVEEDCVSIPRKIDEPIAYTFEHFYNPLHYLSRLEELGINRRRAKELTKEYEIGYKKVVGEIKKL